MAYIIEDAPHPVVTKVLDITELCLISTEVKKLDDGLNYCEGFVRYGFDAPFSIRTTFVAFENYESAVTTNDRLNLVNHPFIMRSLGGVSCFRQHQPCHFLPFPYFDTTYADYLDKRSNKAFEYKRFTPEFIQLTGHVILGIVALQEHGFCCKNLKGKDIAIVKENGSITVKIWHFRVYTGDKAKARRAEWRRLGELIKKAAVDHKCLTLEIEDLCTKLENGILEGAEVLKHSAMLMVREKFENILALNMYVKVHCDPLGTQIADSNTQTGVASRKEKARLEFLNYLDKDVGWFSGKSDVQWITDKKRELGFAWSSSNKFRSFIWEMRCLIEHEDEYIPPEPKVSFRVFQLVDVKVDLESELRAAWAELLLMALESMPRVDFLPPQFSSKRSPTESSGLSLVKDMKEEKC
uniref:Uncharacterized protein n=1 Tax=Leersia perrieri TaxID=77586 RepID=A0A0D9XSF9_9ORYZ